MKSLRNVCLSSLVALVVTGCGAEGPDSTSESVGSVQRAVSNWLWPLAGTDTRDWVVNNYVDLGGQTDYQGGDRTYPGHDAVDIDVATMRAMDANVAIRAVTGGQVISVTENHFDRNITFGCSGGHNEITVRTPDGYDVSYMHLKKDSVPFNVGQAVSAGATVGVVGSSGCSTQAHLHLATYTTSGILVDPIQQGFFLSPPAYNSPLGYMDIVVGDRTLHRQDFMDPRPNVTSFQQGSPLSIAVHTGGGDVGETNRVRVYLPNGALFGEQSKTVGGYQRHWVDAWTWMLPSNATVGTWRADVVINGVVVKSQPFQVSAGTVFYDDFDDGNASGWTTSGGSWSVAQNPDFNWSNDTPVYRQTNSSNNARATVSASTFTNSVVSARIRPLGFNGSDRFVALLGRYQSTSNFYQVALRSNGTLQLSKVVSGTTTVLGSKAYAVTTGTAYDVSLELSGSSLRVFVNGAQELSTTDNALTSGRAGLATYFATANFDLVKATSIPAATLPGAATNPSPASGSTITPPTTLSFTAGANATSHDVHFGTANPPPLVGNQTGTTYNPGTLAAATTYFWRINERNAAGQTTGSVWQFTTSGGSSLLFSDNFESGSTSNFSLLSGTWSIVTDGTNVFFQSNTSNNARASAGLSSWTNQLVSARVKPIAFNGSDRFVAVFARLQDANNYYYATLRSSNKLELKKLVGGSTTTFATKTFTVSPGSWYPVRLEAVGNALRLYVNGTLQLSATDSTFASGKMGLGTYFASARFDDVTVTQQ